MPFFASKSNRTSSDLSPGPRMLPLLPSWAQPKALEVFRFAHYAFKLGGGAAMLGGSTRCCYLVGHVLAKMVGIPKSIVKPISQL